LHCGGNRAQRGHFTAEQLLEALMRLEGMDKSALALRVESAVRIPAEHKPDSVPAPLPACLDAELNEMVFGFAEGVVSYSPNCRQANPAL
jgi:hypothetical protein